MDQGAAEGKFDRMVSGDYLNNRLTSSGNDEQFEKILQRTDRLLDQPLL